MHICVGFTIPFLDFYIVRVTLNWRERERGDLSCPVSQASGPVRFSRVWSGPVFAGLVRPGFFAGHHRNRSLSRVRQFSKWRWTEGSERETSSLTSIPSGPVSFFVGSLRAQNNNRNGLLGWVRCTSAMLLDYRQIIIVKLFPLNNILVGICEENDLFRNPWK